MSASVASKETRLPRAVVRQSAAIAARYAQPANESGAPSADGNVAPASEPATPAATTSAPPPAAPTASTPPVDPRESDPNYWKQRFNVTSGILAKERQERQTERAEALREKTELRAQLASSAASTATPEPIDLTKFYSPEQIEAYGEEQCRVMAKTAMDAAHATAQKLIDAAVRPLREEREREQADRAASTKQAFIDKLIELVPNYQEIDIDPRWSDEHTGWLAQEDENGVQRQQLLNIHIAKGDAARVAKMFKQFIASITPAAPTPPVMPSGTGAAPSGDGQPPASAVTGLTAPTDAEVKDFYKRSAIGKVKDDERAQFEARLKLRNAPG